MNSGIGYLTLGEVTTALSGGEAQRLKLASDIQSDQHDALFVLDEPSTGPHPQNVWVLLGGSGSSTMERQFS